MRGKGAKKGMEKQLARPGPRSWHRAPIGGSKSWLASSTARRPEDNIDNIYNIYIMYTMNIYI